MLERLHESDEFVAHKKVLVVDDDVRNIFAISSILEQHQMQALSAGTGREAIDILERTPDISLILMDIMIERTGDGKISRFCKFVKDV
jgi:CheY-like chemotaxis protein